MIVQVPYKLMGDRLEGRQLRAKGIDLFNLYYEINK